MNNEFWKAVRAVQNDINKQKRSVNRSVLEEIEVNALEYMWALPSKGGK